MKSRLTALLIFGVYALIGICVYAPGLLGPFLLDDFPNLGPVDDWVNGKIAWQSVLLENRSGPLGRPLSMLSFLLNAEITGLTPLPFKSFNLLLHIVCATMIALLFGRLLRRDPGLASKAVPVSLFLGCAWLLLPIHASTVLYVVQRMTQLSTIFSVGALLVYVIARERLSANPTDLPGRLQLFIGLPCLTILAVLAKETGLLVPLFCGVIEIAYFCPSSKTIRANAVRIFFGIFLLVPLLIAVALLVAKPGVITGGYVMRDFTLGQRLLTEPRILFNYVASILVPFSPGMGLIHDDYPISTSWLQPLSTVFAIVGWIAVATAAFRLRRPYPSIFAGVFFFLCGHALESTIFPLDLYFEHRNYLPSFGILLAAAAMLVAGYDRIGHTTPIFRRSIVALSGLLLCTLALVTHGRALVWQSGAIILEQSAVFQPNSRRLRIELITQALTIGDKPSADANIDILAGSAKPGDRAIAAVWRILADCDTGTPVPPESIENLRLAAPASISLNGMSAMELLATRAVNKRCEQLDVTALVSAFSEWLVHSEQPATLMPVWRLRYNLTTLLVSLGRTQEALDSGELTWRDSGHDFGTGALLFQIYAAANRYKDSADVLAELKKQDHGWNYRNHEILAGFTTTQNSMEAHPH